MSDDSEYLGWKEQVKTNPTVIEHGDTIISKNEYNSLKKHQIWNIFRDAILVVVLVFLVILISIYIFNPDVYKNSSICTPSNINQVNSSCLGNLNYNNFTCTNQCNCSFPTNLKITLVNGS